MERRTRDNELEKKTEQWKSFIFLTVFFCAMFALGKTIAQLGNEATPTSAVVHNQAENWGLGGFGDAGSETRPTGNATAESLAEYDAYYIGDATEKVIYLTFDCGYENGNTDAILAALKNHSVPATFFVVGHYLESAPDMIKRMVEEGHTVGNHTYHHPDMSQISDESTFRKEMEDTSNLYKEITGQDMAMYYRPPQGKYSTSNLEMAKAMGYSTFFWSLAYVDWNVDDQPSTEEAMEKMTSRIHPGAVVLLHNTSSTNAKVLDDLLTKWESMGYSFGTLEELCQKTGQTMSAPTESEEN